MTPRERRIALMRADVRPVRIAEQAGVNPSTVYRVLDDLSTSDRIQRMIAKAVNKPVEKVFPARYPVQRSGPRGLSHEALAAS